MGIYGIGLHDRYLDKLLKVCGNETGVRLWGQYVVDEDCGGNRWPSGTCSSVRRTSEPGHAWVL